MENSSLVTMQPSAGGALARENLLHVVMTALQSLKKKKKNPLSLCSSPQLVQGNLCFSQGKTPIPARHRFAETFAHPRAAKPAMPVRLRQNAPLGAR